MTGLSAPGVVASSLDPPFIAMELLEGETLSNGSCSGRACGSRWNTVPNAISHRVHTHPLSQPNGKKT